MQNVLVGLLAHRHVLAPAVVALALMPGTVLAKKLICIDGPPDSYLANHEGFERARAAAGDVILVRGVDPGTLTDWLQQHLANGDTLVIVAHGVNEGEGFQWAGMTYTGFGNGAGQGPWPYPVPANFSAHMNVAVKLCTCWSARDPDGTGPDRALATKIIDALGGAGQGHSAAGFNHIATVAVHPCVVANNAQADPLLDQAEAVLDGHDAWQEQPPVNRPNATSNQQTAAQALLDQQFPGKFTVSITGSCYDAPVDVVHAPNGGGISGCECPTSPPFCGIGRALPNLSTSGAGASMALNEIYASHHGTDTFEFIELIGTCGASLDNHLVLAIEGEGSATNQGTLDRAWDLTGSSIPADGYFVLGDASVSEADFVLGGQDQLENGTQTIYLVNANSPTNVAAVLALVGTDTDPDGDLATSIAALPGLIILDSIAIVDCDYFATTNADHVFDGALTAGPDGACPGGFFPAGVFRWLDFPRPWCPDFLDFNAPVNLNVPRTPGAQNSFCPSAPTVVSYCTPGTTTHGCAATLACTGTPSVSCACFLISASNVEGQKQGLFFYGISGATTSAWGAGASYLCVKAPTQRTALQNSGGTADLCDGAFAFDPFAYVASNPTALGAPLYAGEQAWVQGWFRDPASVKTTNLTDALEVLFTP